MHARTDNFSAANVVIFVNFMAENPIIFEKLTIHAGIVNFATENLIIFKKLTIPTVYFCTVNFASVENL